MAAQKEKKLTEISCTFECLLTQNVYYISQNPKKEGFRELFLLFKTCSAVNFPKNMQILEAWKPTKDMKFRLEFFSHVPSTYELIIT